MKISQSQLNKSRDRKRMTRSFAIAFFVYVPIVGFIFWQTPSLDFAAAGQNSTFSITLSQMTGGAMVSSAELIEQKSTVEKTPIEEIEKLQPSVSEKTRQTKNSQTQPIEKKKTTTSQRKTKNLKSFDGASQCCQQSSSFRRSDCRQSGGYFHSGLWRNQRCFSFGCEVNGGEVLGLPASRAL